MTDQLVATERRTWTWATRIAFASAAPIGDFAGRFLRTIILSRLLLPAEFGTSVALTVVIGTAALISDIGLDRFVLLNPETEKGTTLGAAHTMQILRGLLIALTMVLIARPAAEFFAVPEATDSFRWAALVPLIHCWAHLGPKQAQRDYNYRPDAIANLASSAVSALVAVPAVWLTHGHNAVLVSLVAFEVVYVITTRALSSQRFALSWDRRVFGEAMRYGLPLAANGVGLALFSQADRALVGSFFGVKVLGNYAVVTSLAIVSISPFYAICSNLSLTMLARNRACPERFPGLLMTVVWGFGLFGFAYACGIGFTLGFVVQKVFGDQYGVSIGVQTVFAMIALVRIIRGPSSALLLVDGATARLTMANLLGGTGLAIACLFVLVVPRLESVVLGILTGDLLSLALLQWFLIQRAKALRPQLLGALLSECAAAFVLLFALLSPAAGGLSGRLVITAVCCLAALWMVGQFIAAIEKNETAQART